MARTSAKIGTLGILILTYLIPLSTETLLATPRNHRCDPIEVLTDFDLLAVPESSSENPATFASEYLAVPKCQFLDRWLLPTRSELNSEAEQNEILSKESANLVSAWAFTHQLFASEGSKLKTNLAWTERWMSEFCSWVNEIDSESFHAVSTNENRQNYPTAFVWQSIDESDLTSDVSTDRDSSKDPFSNHSENTDDYWQYYEDCDRWNVKFAAQPAAMIQYEIDQPSGDDKVLEQAGQNTIQFSNWFVLPKVNPMAILETTSEWIDLLEFAMVENREDFGDSVDSEEELLNSTTFDKVASALHFGRTISTIQDRLSLKVAMTIQQLEAYQTMSNEKSKIHFAAQLDALALQLNQIANSIRSSQTAQSVQAIKR